MKHLLLSAFLLLFASNLNAQLYVQPNPVTTTDSYIYANDVVIYVEDDIHLVLNNVEETQASIYLRGDSQLIQGDKVASQNSGTGSISVWQRGYANAFDYNYWASPVGNPDPAIPTGNTNFGIPRIFDVREEGIGSGELHRTRSTQQNTIGTLNGVPSNVTVTGFEGTLRVSSRWIYTMRMGTQYSNWVHIANQNGLAAGEGFTMKGTGTAANGTTFANAHDQLYDFRGRPNDGTISVAVGPDQVTLTGNPYPSALDMRAFLMDLENALTIDGYAHYWDQSRITNSHYIQAYEGGYGTWQPMGGVDHPEYGDLGQYVVPTYIRYNGSGEPILSPSYGNGDYIQRLFAPIGQGFMVKGIANGVATFKNSMRRHIKQSTDTTSVFRRPITGKSLHTPEPTNTPTAAPQYAFPTLRLHVEIDDLYVRDMVMIFSRESTNGADRGWDSKHPSLITAGDAYWKLEGETDPYVIQTRPFDRNSKVPIGFRVKNGQNSFKVNLVEMKGFDNFNNFRLFLYDELNNTYQRLNLGEQALVNHSGSAGQIENRYYLVFKRGHGNSGQNGNGNKSLVVVDFFQNNPQSKLEVSNPDVLDIKNASIYDMRGRLVLTENNIGKVAKFSFPTDNLSTGVYIVKLSTKDNGIIDYKISVHNK